MCNVWRLIKGEGTQISHGATIRWIISGPSWKPTEVDDGKLRLMVVDVGVWR